MTTKKDRVGALIVAGIFIVYGIIASAGKSLFFSVCFFYFAFMFIYILLIAPGIKNVIPPKASKAIIGIVLLPFIALISLLKYFVAPMLQKLSVRNPEILIRGMLTMTVQGIALLLITSGGSKFITEDIYQWLTNHGFSSNTVGILLIIGVIFLVGRALLFVTTKGFEVLEQSNIIPRTEASDHFYYDSVFYKTIWKATMLFLLILFYALVVFYPGWMGIGSVLIGDTVNVVTFVTLIMLIVDCYGKWWDKLRKVSNQVDDNANGAA